MKVIQEEMKVKGGTWLTWLVESFGLKGEILFLAFS